VDVELRLRDIEEAEHTDRGVHAEARNFATRAAEATLEKVVHQAPRHAEVVEGAIEPPLPDVGEGLVPSLGDRFQEVSVEDVVIEKEHLLVEVLPWVVVVGCSVLDVRGGRGLVRPGGTQKPAKFEGALTAERTIRKSRECKKKTAAPALRPRHAPGQSRARITVVAPPRIAVRRHASTFIVNDAPTSTPRPCSSSSHPRRRCTRRRRQPRSDGGNSGSRCSSTKHRDS